MLFSSFAFIFAFLPCVWIIFHILKYISIKQDSLLFLHLAKVFLVLSSLFFYGYFKIEYVPILISSILINFIIARKILNSYTLLSLKNISHHTHTHSISCMHSSLKSSHTSLSPVHYLSLESIKGDRLINKVTGGGHNKDSIHSHIQTIFTNPKFYLIIGIIFNLSLLGFFKYTDFFLENFNILSKLLELDFNIPLPHILLPLALSFVTFQQIAFLIDCYKRIDISDMQEQRENHIYKEKDRESKQDDIRNTSKIDFIDYCLFISFFPQLIAGPIVHHKEMMPQFNALKNSHCLIHWEYMAKGLFIFSIGLFKKVFIADSFAKWANAGFNVVENGGVLNIFESWTTSLSYTFQLYFDFSGYCDMAIGLGLFFGIMLPINFNSPYKALNISEFWRRWHITLGRFLKEYVYIPLGGNRNTKYCASTHYDAINKILTLRNLFFVAFLSGIWHGAGWGFVIWGVLHGVAMCIHRIYSWVIDNVMYERKIETSLSKDNTRTHTKESRTESIQDNMRVDCFLNAHLHNVLESKDEKGYKKDSKDIDFKDLDSKSKVNSTKQLSNTPLAQNIRNFTQGRFYKVLCWCITFNFINITWIFFRSENVQGAINLLKGMFGITWVELPLKVHRMPALLEHIGGRNDTIIYIILGFVVCLYLRGSGERLKDFKSKWTFLICAYMLFIIAFYRMQDIEESVFLYFNF